METMSRIEFYQDVKNEWRWTIRASENGKIIGASTEGYENLKDCAKNAERITGEILPIDDSTYPRYFFIIPR